MKETLVTYEVGLLAKKLGFDLPTLSVYNTSGDLHSPELIEGYTMNGYSDSERSHKLYDNWNTVHPNGNICSAPTQALLQQWLREKKDVFAEVFLAEVDITNSFNLQYAGMVRHKSNLNKIYKIQNKIESCLFVKEMFFNSYSKALEESLKIAMNQVIDREREEIEAEEQPARILTLNGGARALTFADRLRISNERQ